MYSKGPQGYPSGLMIASVNATSISFVWDKPEFGSFLTGYSYKFFSGFKVKRGTIEGIDNVYVTFTDLVNLNETGYALSVAFMNPSGSGLYSPKVFAYYRPRSKNKYINAFIQVHLSFPLPLSLFLFSFLSLFLSLSLSRVRARELHTYIHTYIHIYICGKVAF